MGQFLTRRLLAMLPTAVGVLLLTCLMVHIVPGDPIEVLLGAQALPVDRLAMAHALGLDLPLGQQVWAYFSGVLHGNLGHSFASGRPVTGLILERLPATAELAGAAMVWALALAFPLGVWSATHRGKLIDHGAAGFSLIGFAMPTFWLGPLLIVVFSLWLGWLPVSGKEGLASLVLPALTLGTGMAAITARLLRAALLEVLDADYIRTARAKGVPWGRIVWHHGLHNALLPLITVVFLQTGALLTGAILTEAVFSWPGVGSLIMEGLQSRDYPVVQGCVLFIAAVYMLMTFLSDILYAFADPRVRYQSKAGR